MNPEEFLDLAEELAGSGGEAALRSAVSRAYYALFHVVLEELGPAFSVARDAPAHRLLGQCLRNCGLPAAVPLAQTLDGLRDMRNQCDYAIDRAPPTAATVAARLASARQFVADYRGLARPALLDGIRDFLRKTGRL